MILDILDQGRISVEEAVDLIQMLSSRRQVRFGERCRSPVRQFRLCFRLEDPDEGEDWQVRLMLQELHDLSLFVPVEIAWQTAHPDYALLGREGESVRADVEQWIIQAVRCWPRLTGEEGRRGVCRLHESEAYDFLTSGAALLESSGFGVFLPAWWVNRGERKKLVAHMRLESAARQSGKWLSHEDIVRFDWRVALDGEQLSAEELDLLATAKVPLVRMRGQWMEVSAELAEAARAFWKERERGKITGREAVRRTFHLERQLGEVAGADLETAGSIAELLEALQQRRPLIEPPLPQGFKGTLRPYQMRGYAWLHFLRQWGLGACLADDMGLGKTPQTLALILRDWEEGEERPVLVICPTSVVGNWRNEAMRFAPELPLLVHHGVARQRGEDFARAAGRRALVISSYALLQRDRAFLQQVEWAGVVLDEAQNIKNPATKQARAARALKAEYRIALTGTPVENGIGELWSIMDFLNPGLLGPRRTFERRFNASIQMDDDQRATQAVQALTGPFILRRLKTDPAIAPDLPEKMEAKTPCELTLEQVSLYSAVVQESMEVLADERDMRRRGAILATLTKLRQVCNHPVQLLKDGTAVAGRSGKVERLCEMLEEVLANGERALVFTQFREMGELLWRHLTAVFEREVLFLHGGVCKSRRDDMIARFQDAGDGPGIFLLCLKAGGTGLNLTRASCVFHFDRWWNPAVENQATDRAFRIGQTRNVQVYKFYCSGTVEEKMDAIIERKREIAECAVGVGEQWITELSAAELKELFSLSKETL